MSWYPPTSLDERKRALSAYQQARNGLPPDQRQQLHDDLHSLPQEDRRDLRRQYDTMSPEQREQHLAEYRAGFTINPCN